MARFFKPVGCKVARMPTTARLFHFRTHSPSSKTATRSSSSEHSMLKRLSTTKALLFLSHRTFRLDRLVPGFRRSMTCGVGRGEKEKERVNKRRCRRDRQKRPIVSAILNGPRNWPSFRGRRAAPLHNYVHGDPSRCSLGAVDIRTKITFYYKEYILNCSLCVDVNNT